MDIKEEGCAGSFPINPDTEVRIGVHHKDVRVHFQKTGTLRRKLTLNMAEYLQLRQNMERIDNLIKHGYAYILRKGIQQNEPDHI